MSFAICVLATISVRKSPDLLSEMTTQLLFGECYEIIEERGIFQKIQVEHDGYTGWIDGRQGEPMDHSDFKARRERAGETPILEDLVAPAHLGEEELLLVRGSSLPGSINGRRLNCDGKTILPVAQPFTPDRIHSLALGYLHAPYCWGGRSPLGIDCSGLVQNLYRFFNIRLERDSMDQSYQGAQIEGLEVALPGDLAFFQTVSDQSSHVGLVVPGGIIHASGRVRFDLLTEDGIHNRDTGDHTHSLISLRRPR